MDRFTIKEFEFLRKLKKEFPSDYTIEDILKRDDLNPYKESEPQIPIEEVEFEISGILKYAYECTGDTYTYSGTIKDIIVELINDDAYETLLEEIENGEAKEGTFAKIKDLWTENEIKQLAEFFLGKRDDPSLDEVKAVSNRKVTLDEIIECIKEIDMLINFYYEDTIVRW